MRFFCQLRRRLAGGAQQRGGGRAHHGVCRCVLGAPAGYALARYDFKGQTVYRVLIVMTRAFPLAILALPLVTRFISVGLYDTHLGVALGAHARWRCRSPSWCRPRLFMGDPARA